MKLEFNLAVQCYIGSKRNQEGPDAGIDRINVFARRMQVKGV